jgi:hypothetical protein
MMIGMLSKQDFIFTVPQGDPIESGAFIIREGNGFAQMARFVGYDEQGFKLENVIDLNDNAFVASQGILRPGRDDTIYVINSRYGNDDQSHIALDIVKRSALYERHPAAQRQIIDFVKAAFAPRFILFLEEINSLHYVFIPIQQRFRIGRYAVKDKWENLNTTKFRDMLDRLIQNEYLTYMGYIPMGTTAKPIFFSLGTETHLETDLKLKREPFLYPSNCGGNIKLHKVKDDMKYFLVDAGSSYKGNGVNSKLEDAESVSVFLKSMYPQHQFIPVEGRGAIGSKYSF